MSFAPVTQVLITGERSKLPVDYQALFDEQKPLPSGVQFFEERKTVRSIFWRLLLGIGLLGIGVLGSCFGLFVLVAPSTSTVGGVTLTVSIMPFIIGLVFVLSGVLLLRSLRQSQRLRTAQQSGQATRHGIYLTPNVLISHNEFDYTLIPRSEFRGVQSTTVHYVWNEKEKAFTLPGELVNATPQAMLDAIQQWANATTDWRPQ
ncbi:MAG: hypothetical protein U0175_32755 [Caldilineaceae bacterium]